MQHDPSGDAVAGVFLAISALVVVAVYWLPVIVAYRRKLPERSQVLVVDLLLGWTGVGWVIALVMALRPLPPAYPPYQPPARWR